MPIDKCDDKRVRCCICGEASFQLVRLRDGEGKKIKPARYVCKYCLDRKYSELERVYSEIP